MILTDYVSIGLTLGFLGFGTYYDLKAREVPTNWLWLPYGGTGLLLTLYRLASDPAILYLTVASIALSVGLSFGMWFFGLFAGADFWAMTCLALTMPLPPTSLQPVLGYVHPFFPLTVVITSYACSLSLIVWYASKNSAAILRGEDLFTGLNQETSWKKFLAFITGYTVEVTKLRSTFYLYPMEEVTEDSAGARRRLKLYEHAEADRGEQVGKLVSSLNNVGSPSVVWVTAGLPMLLFFLIGTLLILILGDPIFYAIRGLIVG